MEAALRRCQREGAGAYLLRRGDADSGAVVLKLRGRDGLCRVLTQGRDAAGRPGWIPVLAGERVAEAEADSYLERACSRDPDVWLVEVEDPAGTPAFVERMV